MTPPPGGRHGVGRDRFGYPVAMVEAGPPQRRAGGPRSTSTPPDGAEQLQERARMHDELAVLYEQLGKTGSAHAERETAKRLRISAARREHDATGTD